MKDIGDRVREARERLGISQAELAARMGVADTTVFRWEHTKNRIGFSVKTLVAAARTLETSVDVLLGAASPPPLDDIEQALLEAFRSLPQKQRLFQLLQLSHVARLCAEERAGAHGLGRGIGASDTSEQA